MSTISLNHGIAIVTSSACFIGSSDIVFPYQKLSKETWEAYMSSSIQNVQFGWAYSVTGVVEGFWDVSYVERRNSGNSDYFTQRPVL